MTFGSRSGVTSESQAGSSGLQSAGFNMLGATPNPLKQRPLLLRLLCLPYPQEAGGTHKFARRGRKENTAFCLPAHGPLPQTARLAGISALNGQCLKVRSF